MANVKSQNMKQSENLKLSLKFSFSEKQEIAQETSRDREAQPVGNCSRKCSGLNKNSRFTFEAGESFFEKSIFIIHM